MNFKSFIKRSIRVNEAKRLHGSTAVTVPFHLLCIRAIWLHSISPCEFRKPQRIKVNDETLPCLC